MHDDPYSPPEARLIDLEPQALVLADRWLRLAGAFIDGLIMMVILLPLMYAGGYFDGMLQGRVPGFPEQALWSGIGFAVFVLVQGYPLSASGQTWGKKLLKMRIVDLDGHQPRFASLIALRYGTTQVITLVPFVGPWYSLLDSLFIFGEDRRCLHDRIAGTRVVEAK